MQQPDQPTVVCERCGRTTDAERAFPAVEGGSWGGTPGHAVCPGCQYVERHPRCESWIDLETDERALPDGTWVHTPREEWDTSRLLQCDYIDLSVTWIEGENDDDASVEGEWRCPRCGGTAFVWVHRDYPPSGLRPGMFRIEVLEDDDDA